MCPSGEVEVLSTLTRGVGDLYESESGDGCCCWVGVGVELLGTADVVAWVSDAMYSEDGLAFCALTRAEAGFGEEESGGVGNLEAPPVDEMYFCSVAVPVSVSVDSQDRLEGVALGTEGR